MFVNHTRTADQGRIPPATIFLNNEQQFKILALNI